MEHDRHPLRFDHATRRVTCHGTPLSLNDAEFDVLHVLAQHTGRLLTDDELLWRAGLPCTPTARAELHERLARIRDALTTAGTPRLFRTAREYGCGLHIPDATTPRGRPLQPHA